MEQLVEVPTVVSPSSFLQLAEQNVGMPVPGARGFLDYGGLQGFHPEQSPSAQHSVEQIVDIPVPGACGGGGSSRFVPGQSSAASSSFLPQEAFDFFFGRGTFPRHKKSAKVAVRSSARVHTRWSSSTAVAHHEGTEVRDDLWVQITTDDRAYFWNRLERTSHWEMPPGIRPGWVMSRDGLFVRLETQEVLQSISGMH